MKSQTIDTTRTIGEAWTQATRLSAGGLLHAATLGFLRLRIILHNEKSKLQTFEPGGKGQTQNATQGMEEAQAMSPSNRASAKATCVVDKLLSKVERELRTHLRFLKSNHFAALQLPLPRRASSDRTSRIARISDALVKNNYRRLALQFHPGWWYLRLLHLPPGFTTLAVHYDNDQGELFAAPRRDC
ncbi:unnamed protein product [Ectocarpus sp. CCAP 1310/34]|nr:unnamed protein product [Ectocarpus sp. CCAP 1310/34]